MKKKLIIISTIFILHLTSIAQSPDWSQNIAPILYGKCLNCHRQGGIAPFPLETYQQASAWSSMIQQDISSGKMPPWPPDTTYQRFTHERILSQAEISAITTWVNNGAPQGNPSLAPPLPQFPNYVLNGTPDLILTIPTYTSTAASGGWKLFLFLLTLLLRMLFSSFAIQRIMKTIYMWMILTLQA